MEQFVTNTKDMLNESHSLVLIVIVNFNGGSDILSCIRSVEDQSIDCKTIVVDNGSTDGSDLEVGRSFPIVEILRPSNNIGFGAAVNIAASKYPYDVIVVLNPDIILQKDCLRYLIEELGQSQGVVGPVLDVVAAGRHEAGLTINHSGMPVLQLEGKAPLFIQGCALVTTRHVFDTVGGFDPRYFLFCEDVEFCWRALLAGFEVKVTPNALAVLMGGGSTEGGYVREGTPYYTTGLRISLRERNTIALFISCAPWWWLPLVIPFLLLRASVLAIGALFLARPSLAKALIGGIGWNVKEYKASVRRRKSLNATRDGDRKARLRFVSGPLMIRTVLDHGMVRVGKSVPMN